MMQSEAIRGILDAIESRLKEASAKGGRLSAVHNKVIRGDRSPEHPQPPSLWVFWNDATITHVQTIRERWVLRIVLVAVTRADRDLQPGTEDGTDLISEAMSSIIDGRRLGLNWVHDVQKVRMQSQPARRPSPESKLAAVSGELNVIYSLIED